MKTRILISSLCILAIVCFDTLNRSAIAEPPVAVSATNQQTVSTPDDDTNNLAAVLVGKKYGYRDTAGKMAIAPRFDDVYEFFDGVAAVQIDEKWGFIDRVR